MFTHHVRAWLRLATVTPNHDRWACLVPKSVPFVDVECWLYCPAIIISILCLIPCIVDFFFFVAVTTFKLILIKNVLGKKKL